MSGFGDLLSGKKTAAPASTPVPAPAPAPEPVVEPVVEEVVGEESEEEVEEESVELFPYESDVSFHDMSKRELEEYGRTVGIELDRRHSRTRLVSELENYLLTDDQEDQ